MKQAVIACVFAFASVTAVAQPANAPDLGYAPAAEFFQLPAGANFGAVSGVALNSKGHIFILNRGPQPLLWNSTRAANSCARSAAVCSSVRMACASTPKTISGSPTAARTSC